MPEETQREERKEGVATLKSATRGVIIIQSRVLVFEGQTPGEGPFEMMRKEDFDKLYTFTQSGE